METRMNQKGYALLIVLFLIVFIMTVMAIFMRGSISTAKQEHIVDSNNMSVVAAEMGMDFYLNYIGNKEKVIFRSVQDEAYNKVVCNNEGKPEDCVELNDIQSDAKQNYYDRFQSMVNSIKEEVHILNTEDSETNQNDIFFKSLLLNILSSRSDGFVLLKIDVKGVSPTRDVNLTATIKYTLPEIIVKETNIKIPSNQPDTVTNPSAVFDFFKPENAIFTKPCGGGERCTGTYFTTGNYNYTNFNNTSGFIWFHKGILDTKNNMNSMGAVIVLESLKTVNNIKIDGGTLVLLGKENNAGELPKATIEIKKKGNGKVCVNLDGYSVNQLKELKIDGHVNYYSNKADAAWPGSSSSATKFPGSLVDFVHYCSGIMPNEIEDENPENGFLYDVFFERENVNYEVDVEY